MKKYIAGLCALVLILALAGCGNTASKTPEGSGAAQPVQAESQTEKKENAYGLADGLYKVDVDTGSNMFHINEAKEGKGDLTVNGEEMTLHITLPSKNIVNLYLGTAEEAEAAPEDALIQPTVDEVTYSDGITEEVYGFDIPAPAIDEAFDVAIIGTHGNWYTHGVTISNPVPAAQ